MRQTQDQGVLAVRRSASLSINTIDKLDWQRGHRHG